MALPTIAALVSRRGLGASPLGRRRHAAASGRGQIDAVRWEGGTLTVHGWLFALEGGVESYRMEIDGRPRAEAPALERPDVAAVFPRWPQAFTAGFELSCPAAVGTRGWKVLEVLALRAGSVVARIRLGYHPDYRAGIPDPPAPLRLRVVRSTSLDAFWLGGLQSYGELCAAIGRHRKAAPVRRLLDWGCGCGRLASLFQAHWPRTEVHGCDIDAESVDWCRRNLAQERFRAIAALPPTPYPDASFDVVVAYSVLTHLDRTVQAAWLAELRRLLVPGGLLLASLHGDFALRFDPDVRVAGDIAADGISDGRLDDALDGIAPQGFYRCVYQTREYTLREMAQAFEFLDYRSAVLTNFQDLVVLRRPAVGWLAWAAPWRRSAIGS